MRYKVLDSWRGICALLVVLFHAKGHGPIGESSFIRGSFLFVDFFFVLSGFVMAEAYATRIESGRGFREFLVRRFGRVWPLHAVMLGAFLAVELSKLALVRLTGSQFSHAPFTDTMSPDGFLPSLLLLHAMGLLPGLTWNIPSWSIAAEFWSYVVFGLVVWRLRAKTVIAAVTIASVAAVTLVLYSRQLMDVSFDLGVVRCLYGFFLGVVVHRISRVWRATHLAFGTAIELLSVTLGFGFVAMAHDTTLAFVSPLVFATVIFVFARSDGAVSNLLQTRVFASLGLWSYSIYMTHIFLLGIVNMSASVLGKLGVSRQLSQPWQDFRAMPGVSDAEMLVFALGVIAVSSLTFRLIEMPAQQAVNRWAKSLH